MTNSCGFTEPSIQQTEDHHVRANPRVRVAILAVLLTVCAFGLGCGGSDPKPTTGKGGNAAGQPMPVTVSAAQSQDVPYYLTGLGSVTAYYTVNVKSRVDGQLTEVRFKEGQIVKEGELLAVIDPRPYQVALEQAQAALYRDQASLRDAQLNYTRYKGLLQDSGAMSQQQVDTQRSTADQFDGSVRNDQATIDSAKLNLVYCHITAPVSGRIGLRQVDPGNIVHAADTTPMFIITQLQPIAVLFTLPEDNLPAVSQHLAKVPLSVEAYSRDDQTKLATGKLLTIDNQIDQTTGTGKLKSVFDNKDNALWPNQFVNIRLLLDTEKNVTVIPAAAVQRGPQGTYVFVVKQGNTVDVRPVTIAFTQNNISVISNGLSPNEVVVTDGQDKLQASSHVTPRTQNQSGSQTQPAAGNAHPQKYPGGQASSGNKASGSKASGTTAQ
jgi:membrane fusion protein, multidrug efflux system